MVVRTGQLTTYQQNDSNYGHGGGGVSDAIVIPDYCFGQANAVVHGSVQMVNTRAGLTPAPSSAQIGSGQLGVWVYYPRSPNELYGGPPTVYGPQFFTYSTNAALPNAPTLNPNYSGYIDVDCIITPYNSGQLTTLVNRKATWATWHSAYFWWPHVFNVIKNSNGTYNYNYAYTVWKMKAGVNCMSARVTTNNTIAAQYERMFEVTPEIWVRPASGNNIAQPRHFGMLTAQTYWKPDGMWPRAMFQDIFMRTRGYGGIYDPVYPGVTNVNNGVSARGSWFYGTSHFNRSFRIFTDQRTTCVWDYKITMPGPHWGKIPTTTDDKYTDPNNKTMGVEAYTTYGQQFHASSPGEQHVLYSSLARAAKVLDVDTRLPETAAPGNWKTFQLKNASGLAPGVYQIQSAPGTNWNYLCNTSGVNYYQGSIVHTRYTGSGTGKVYDWGPVSTTGLAGASGNMIWGNSTSGPANYPNKNYCLMNPTAKGTTSQNVRVYNSVATGNGMPYQHFFTNMYRWEGAYKIGVYWHMYQYIGKFGSVRATPLEYVSSSASGANHLGMAGSGVLSTYIGKQLYAVADFGEPDTFTWDFN
jgi:hypothetical protein